MSAFRWFYYKNVSQCTVLRMSNSFNSFLSKLLGTYAEQNRWQTSYFFNSSSNLVDMLVLRTRALKIPFIIA